MIDEYSFGLLEKAAREKGLSEGIAQGIEQGKEQAMLLVAKKCFLQKILLKIRFLNLQVCL